MAILEENLFLAPIHQQKVVKSTPRANQQWKNCLLKWYTMHLYMIFKAHCRRPGMAFLRS